MQAEEGRSRAAVDLAQGLVAGWMSDQVKGRGTGVQRIGLLAGAIGLLLAVLADGWLRGIGLFLLFGGVVFFGAIWIVRWPALFVIRRFAEPASMADHRAEIEAAINEVDLPTSPLAIVRFLVRLRKGPGPELDRMKSVVSRLQTDLHLG